eukprot:4884266-Pyramimonas_sp.AAC.2
MKAAGVRLEVNTYNNAMSACERGQQWEAAIAMFVEMQSAGVEADTAVFNTLIHTCAGQGALSSRLRPYDDARPLTYTPYACYTRLRTPYASALNSRCP